MRDDFSQSIKISLAARVAHCCSNPDCRATTSGPQGDTTGTVNVGVAAHITAASSGGKRFDGNLTSEQRSSIINGIWLCQNCAHKIDHDEPRYSVAVLYHWKLQAENAAHQGLGKPAGAKVTTSCQQVPMETIRVVQDKNSSWWSDGADEDGTLVMSAQFMGSIAEIAGKQVRIVTAELCSPPLQALRVLICDGHNGARPQFLRPSEVANVFIEFTMPPVSDLEADGTWRSSIILMDQFANRHEVRDAVFHPHPFGTSGLKH